MPLPLRLATIIRGLPLAGKAALMGSAAAIVGGFAFLGGAVLLARNQDDAPAPLAGQDVAAGQTLPLGRVAYVRDGSLWTLDLDSGEDGPLVDKKLHATVGASPDDLSLHSPKWSPRGDWIAYGVRSTGTVSFDLAAAVPANGGSGEPVFLGAAGARKWDPTGDLIAVQEAGGGGLWVQSPNPGGRQQLVNLSLGDFVWSPDGQYLAAGPDRDSSPAMPGDSGDLYVIGLHDVQPTVTPTDTSSVPGVKVGYAGEGPVQVQSWSPDGGHILFWEGGPGRGIHLLSLATDGKAATPLASVLPHPSSVAWSPDGRLIALIEWDDPEAWFKKRLVVMSPDGERMGTLLPAVYAEAEPSWAPDGSRLALVRMPGAEPGDRTPLGASRIWAAEADGSGAVQLTDDAAYSDRFPQWSGDGSRILFVRLPAESIARGEPLHPELWTMNSDGSDEQRVGVLPLIDGLNDGGYVDWGQYFDWYQPQTSETPPATTTPSPSPAPLSPPDNPSPLLPEVIALTEGDPGDLPEGISLIIHIGCPECGGAPGGLLRVSRDSYGVHAEPVFYAGLRNGTDASGLPTETDLYVANGVGFKPRLVAQGDGTYTQEKPYITGAAVAPDGSEILVSLCVSGACGFGVPGPAGQPTTQIYASEDGGSSWHQHSFVDGAAAILDVFPDGRALVQQSDDEGNIAYFIEPGHEKIDTSRLGTEFGNPVILANGQVAFSDLSYSYRTLDGQTVVTALDPVGWGVSWLLRPPLGDELLLGWGRWDPVNDKEAYLTMFDSSRNVTGTWRLPKPPLELSVWASLDLLFGQRPGASVPVMADLEAGLIQPLPGLLDVPEIGAGRPYRIEGAIAGPLSPEPSDP